MISSDVMRGYNDTMILFLLMQGDSYGYEISKRIREISDQKYIMKETTLYSAFTRLENNDCIKAYFGDESGGKRRTYYKITETGKQYYEQKCDEWDMTKEIVEKFITKKENKTNGNY